MTFGIIAGTVVATKKNDGIEGARYLLVDKSNQNGERKGDYIVALDMVGAGYGELVIVSEGSPARETPLTTNKPFDAMIVGIVDLVDEFDKVIFKK